MCDLYFETYDMACEQCFFSNAAVLPTISDSDKTTDGCSTVATISTVVATVHPSCYYRNPFHVSNALGYFSKWSQKVFLCQKQAKTLGVG